jgi:sigma-54 dependent transcriptional regulator, acetoin dehydrogenase operon transcriptional activator AcoR
MSMRPTRTFPPAPAPASETRIAPRLFLDVSFCPHPDGTTPHIALDEGETRIGREPRGAPGRVLTLDDPRVSRLHATLTCVSRRGEVTLADCESRNGVFVNGRRIERQQVHAGDVIRIGNSVLLIRHATRDTDGEEAMGILGRSLSVNELRRVIRRVGPTALPVVIVGPTGSGKELVARGLHAESGRAGPFLALNCATLPGTLVENALFGHRKGAYTDAGSDEDGAFVRAQSGTLFLDEIGDLALEAQPKLLRALENREVFPVGAAAAIGVDVRVVVATHVPLDVAMREGRFREDLYARLEGVVVNTPPLADRREDVLLLLARFLGASQRPMTADFVESLLAYGWPRNVRELQKLAERLPVLNPDATAWQVGMLDEGMRLAVHGRAILDDASPDNGPPSHDELVALLERCNGNVSRLSRVVHRSRKQVYRWMDQRGVSRGAGRHS